MIVMRQLSNDLIKQIINNSKILLALVILFASLPRVYAVFRRVPNLTPDSFSYLNLARILRGEQVPHLDMDKNAWAPRDDQGYRTPVYPIILNTIFFFSPKKGTEEVILQRIQRHKGFEIDAWHLKFLRKKENLKFVQITQHALGILSTVFLFQLLLSLTSNSLIAFFGALLVIGWNPNWFWGVELSVWTETLTVTLLLTLLWGLCKLDQTQEIRPRSLWWVSLLGGLLALTRPQFILATILPFSWWLYKVIRKSAVFSWHSVVALLLPPLILVGSWITRNGIRYGFWGISTVTGFNLCMHFTVMNKFDVFDVTLQRALYKHLSKCPLCINSRFVIIHAAPDLIAEWKLPFPAVSKRLEHEALKAIIHHPDIFMKSIITAIITFFKPLPFPGGFASFFTIWFPFGLLLKVGGLALVLFMPRRFPHFIRILAAFSVATILLTVVVAGGAEPDRYSFSMEPLLALLTFVGAYSLYLYLRKVEESK
jgi:hypothetical protein